MIGVEFNPLMTMGGLESVEIDPSLAIKIQLRICLVLTKSMLKAESVENCAPSKITALISVAPNEAFLKLQPVRFV